MAVRILIIFLPSVVGLMWLDEPEASITLSLASSIFVAGIAQTKWFRQPSDSVSFTRHLLRPASIFHLIFIAYNVLGGAAYALNAAGYSIAGGSSIAIVDLSVIAQCQRFMLLGHASVTAGMKLAGFRYEKPKYIFPSIPPYSLIVVSFTMLGAGTLASNILGLGQLSQKLLTISAVAISVDIALCIRNKRFKNLVVALLILVLNLLQQSVSGWKGNILWTMIMLGAMLYPSMPRRVVFGGIAFIIFWALYFYPFGLALRPLIWVQNVEQDKAIEISMDRALNMSLDERLDTVWEMMVGRANDMGQFVKYVQYVPTKHPYYQFDLLSDSLIAFVPRFVWPDKPDLERLSMQRVYAAGITSQQSFVSAKSNFYQDAYLSFGEVGIVLACLFFGALVILLSRSCERLFGGYDIGTCLIFMSLLGTIITQPPNFEYYFAAIAISFVLIYALFALGKTIGWIVPASSAEHSTEGQTRSRHRHFGGRRYPLPSPDKISSQPLKYRQ